MKTLMNVIGWTVLAIMSTAFGAWMVFAVANSSGVCL